MESLNYETAEKFLGEVDRIAGAQVALLANHANDIKQLVRKAVDINKSKIDLRSMIPELAENVDRLKALDREFGAEDASLIANDTASEEVRRILSDLKADLKLYFVGYRDGAIIAIKVR
jgi:hypothetical protein